MRPRQNRVTALALVISVAVALVAACPKRPPEPAKPLPTVEPGETEAIGVFHTLEQGETLWGLSLRYGIDVEELIEVNGISDPRDLRVGRLVFIPDVDAMALPPPLQQMPPPPPVQSTTPREARLVWPVAEGVLYSGFGVRQGVRHDGIDLGAPIGTPVLAAGDGEVIFVGTDRAFGNLVLIKHPEQLVTVYAHNHEIHVQMGQRVRAGQAIASLGDSGRSEGPHLHFEVREGTRPVDPLAFLPDE